MIQAVMFDMDGLLLDSEAIMLEAFLAVGRSEDLPIIDEMPAIFRKCIGLRDVDGQHIIETHIGPHMARDVFNRRWGDEIETRLAKGISAKAGATQLLSALVDAGIPAGVVTSTRTARAEAHLEEAGLLPCLTRVLGGDQVLSGKPDPEGYIAMARHLGAEPAVCAAFEDSDTGTRAAVASGARVVQVPDLVQPSDAIRALGHHVAKDLISGARHLGLPV